MKFTYKLLEDGKHYMCMPVLDKKPIELYVDEGWINWKNILDKGYPYMLAMGGRGVGKSYGAVDEAQNNPLYNGHHIYMRRTATITDLMCDPSKSQIAKLAHDFPDREIDFEKTRFGGFYKQRDKFCGHILPLSTFANIRGMNFDDSNLIMFDEVVAERGESYLKDEGGKLDNVYETVNRNREIGLSIEECQPPVQMLCMGNSDNILAPVLTYWNVSRDLYEMQKTGENQRYYPDRGIAIFNFTDSPISKLKSNTALYRRNKGSVMANMAINNQFDFDERLVERRELNQFHHIIGFGGINIYRHKNKCEYYCTERRDPCLVKERDRIYFKRKYTDIFLAFLEGNIFFSDPLNQALFMDYMGIKY